MTEVLIVVGSLTAFWAASAVNYHYMFGRWLRLRYWPLANGLALIARRRPDWEVAP